MAKTVLVIDDDPTQRRLIQAAVEKAGFACRTAPDGESGFTTATEAGADVILLDLTMPGLSGMETLQRLSERIPDVPVVMLTATSGIDTIVTAMRSGAVDFIVKPANPERVVVSIRNALKMSSLSGEVKRLTRKSEGGMGFDDMIASAPTMRQVVRLGQRAASSDIPVLILGESGVGKEVIARCIQGASERAGKPFLTVNCGAIPENLVESILFGHEKGAFTGAVSTRPMAVRSSSMRSVSFRSTCRSSCCAPCRKVRSMLSARAARPRSMSASSPPRTRTSPNR